MKKNSVPKIKKFPIHFGILKNKKEIVIDYVDTFYIDTKNDYWDWALGNFELELTESLYNYEDKISKEGNFCWLEIGYEKVENYEAETGKPRCGGHFIRKINFIK